MQFFKKVALGIKLIYSMFFLISHQITAQRFVDDLESYLKYRLIFSNENLFNSNISLPLSFQIAGKTTNISSTTPEINVVFLIFSISVENNRWTRNFLKNSLLHGNWFWKKVALYIKNHIYYIYFIYIIYIYIYIFRCFSSSSGRVV